MPHIDFPEGFSFGFRAQPQNNPAASLLSMLSPNADAVVRNTRQGAAAAKHPSAETPHLLVHLLDNPNVNQILNNLDVDRQDILARVMPLLDGFPVLSEPVRPNLGGSVLQTIFFAAQIAGQMGGGPIEPEHLFYALLAQESTAVSQLLTAAGVTPDAIKTSAIDSEGNIVRGPRSKTPTLDQYSTDLTQAAREGKLDPVVGRAVEINQTIEILMRRTKNNPVLIGEPGVGKTAVIEGISQAIVNGQVPDLLKGKRVVALNLTSMVAGTKFRGEFEERITKSIDEIAENKENLIVFIDELHTVVGAGAGGNEGGMDAGNILKPRLARGELHLIGATTLKEFRRIEKDGALERRFQPVKISEPTNADAVLILDGIKKNFEAHHGVIYTPDAISAAVELSSRYVSDRFLPDKAIDLIDQAGARKRLNAAVPTDLQDLQERVSALTAAKEQAVANEQYDEASSLKRQLKELHARIEAVRADTKAKPLQIEENDIAEVISLATGIPVSRLNQSDRARLAKLEDELHQRVIGQNEAMRLIAKSVRRARSGMGDPSRPIGSFLFLGPTGVGKTEAAKALAETIFGSERNIIRFDMSEYSEKHTASRLVGAPPGYVGYEEAGQLTERVRRNPYSVILLDEIEKAHPDIFNLLLQVLDDGRLTDGQGRTVDFRNTVIIMTSNVGSEFMAARSGAVGFGTSEQYSPKDLQNRVMGKLRETMRPEFINRLDEIVLFEKLTLEQVKDIAHLMLLETETRLATQGVSLVVPDAALAWLAQEGYDPQYGARPMRRLIQRRVEDEVADLLINEQVQPGDQIRLVLEDDDLQVLVEQQQTQAEGIPA